MPALRQREPGFAGLAHIVCGQQLSTASAGAIWGRLTAAFDPFDPEPIRKARADRLGRLGLSAAKIKTLKNIARELAAERLNLDVLAEEDADAAHHTLTALHGIGPWTADVYLLFCLGHGDAWPAGDIAIQEAIKVGLGLQDAPDRQADGAAGGTVASAARRGGASVVELLSRAEEARGRDREVSLAAQPDPVLARACRDEVDHRAHRGQVDEIRMRQQPEIGDADELLRGDPHQIGIIQRRRSMTAPRFRGRPSPRPACRPATNSAAPPFPAG